MAGEPISRRLVVAMSICLSLALLLLGLEFSLVLREIASLSPGSAGMLGGVAVLLYAALAWRGSQGRQTGSFGAWLGTMVACHAGLGMTVGAIRSAAMGVAPELSEVARSACGASLPVGVLQVGYGIGLASFIHGRDVEVIPAPVRPSVARRERLAHQAENQPVPAELADDVAREAYLEVYATAIGKLRARDHQALIEYAVEAAKCEGGLLMSRSGDIIASTEAQGLSVDEVANALPEMMANLEKLSGPSRAGSTLLRASLGGYDLLAAPGRSMLASLIGPLPGERDTAEVILPALIARAEALARGPEDKQESPS
ncbi:MAG TPA: hypothetical protein QGH10_01215 [Armatimonadota bacterium]|jgi:hypothetical protein|nr:hypothetical protein [Armatimonadota bacterium]